MTGGLVSIVVMLPNLLWMAFPPRGQSERGTATTGKRHKLMEIIEWVGRFSTLVIPFFYRIEVGSTRQVIAVVVMALALLVYYAGWARYFLRDRSYELLYEPFVGVPIPQAISSIVCFFAASVLLGSWYLALGTAILAVGHLWISAQESRDLKDRPCGRETAFG